MNDNKPKTTTLVNRITRPRRERGRDWGSERFILARMGVEELLWWTSRSEWTGRLGGCRPAPACLIVVDALGSWRVLHEGGRLSKRMLSEHAGAINEFFGCEVADKLDPKKTLIIEA